MNMEEEMNNEELQENKKMTLEQAEKEIVKKSTSKLYAKLQELQERLEKEELSPIKRFILESKLSIIETRLERQLAKLDIQDMKKEYEQTKDEWYEKHNEKLKEKQEELDDLFEQIEKQERIIGQKTSNMKNRTADYNEINNIGKGKNSSKNTRSTYQFTSTKKLDEVLQKQQEKLEELKTKKDLKKEEIINFRKEFIENEKGADAEFAESLKEYKPSIWQSFKTALKKIANNFTNWRENQKEERQAIKNAKAQAITDTRKAKTADSIAENTIKMETFKDRVNSHISLEEQSKYSEKAQREPIEKVEGEVIIDEHQEK